MRALRRFLIRLATWVTKHRDEERLREEVEEHITLQTAEHVRAGMSPVEARRQALARFGGVEAIKEQYRDVQSLPFLDGLLQDVRYALRQLRQAPSFTVTAVLTLALGIGVTTSIFTLMEAILLRSLPVAEPDQLYRVGKTARGGMRGGFAQPEEWKLVSYELYEYLRANTTGFEELAAFQTGRTSLAIRRVHGGDKVETRFGELVSGNYFTMFGVRAHVGRTLSMADDIRGAPPVAVISYRLWDQTYGRDPSVIGGAFTINGTPFTVVGVTPPSFYGGRLDATSPDLYLPLATEPLMAGGRDSLLDSPDTKWLYVIGRIRHGTNVAATESQMRMALQQWLRLHWSDMDAEERRLLSKQILNLAPGGAGVTTMRQEYDRWLGILMTASAFVLLIVCANVANLLLVRGMERRQQIALSMALGAQRSRLLRQALTESLVLSSLGGIAGLAVAFLGTRTILYFAFSTATVGPISAMPSIPVLLFACGVSATAGIVFGLAPAWFATHIDPIEALRGAGRSTRAAGSRSRQALVVVQTALSIVLLSASGLLLQTLRNLEHQRFGFEPEHRTVINIDPLLAGYKPEQLESLYERIHDSLEALPGVASVASGLFTPLGGGNVNDPIFVEGRPEPGANTDYTEWTRVSVGFFEAIGNPIVKGRPFTAEDTARSRHVAVVNEAFARRFFKNENPIGRHFGKGGAKYAGDYEIIGVAKDAKYLRGEVNGPVRARFFLPQSQSTEYTEQWYASLELGSHYLRKVVVRMSPDAKLSEAVVRRALASVDPNLPISGLRSMAQQVAEAFGDERLLARLTSLFSVLALVLASIGMYGVIAYNVRRRTNEIGVRMALGADRGGVVRLMLRGACILIAWGVVFGLPVTWAAGQFLGNQLYGLHAHDPLIISLAVAVLAASAFAAALIPAFRASSISPLGALRAE